MLNFSKFTTFLIVAICLAGFWFAAPNVAPAKWLAEAPGFVPKDKINLGLDLQGGAHLLFEIDMDTYLADKLAALEDDIRRELREANIRYTGLAVSGREVVVDVRDDTDRAEALRIVRGMAQSISGNLAVPARNLSASEGENGRITVAYTDAGLTQIQSSAVQQSLEVVRRRIDALGTKEPSIQSQGSDRILVQVPGAKDSKEITAVINAEAKLSFHLVDHTVTEEDIANHRLPPGTVLYPFANDPAGLAQLPVRRRPFVTGENLTDAQPGFESRTGQPVVNLSYDLQGARRLSDVTAANVGHQFAVVLDGKIITAPVIRSPIPGGRAEISGSFTVESANQLAILLRAGALPAPLKILEERSVGPDLGADSIAAGKIAALIGAAAVVVFMILAYGGYGVAADLALAINIVLIFGLLSFLGATLTLPGIAGIVLTIGMAVDANVLVFERVREELRLGKPPLSAFAAGYSNAMSTIMDANITTLIAAVILFQYGTGPIRGFAVTLAIGVVTSVFSAVMVTRLMIAAWLRSARPQTVKL
jgi:protein-export membrane protein SecD